MAENITRTVYGSYIQTCHYIGVTPDYFDFTTLNQYLNINKMVVPTAVEIPVMGYFCWGNRGHDSVTGADGIARNKHKQHKATDSNLFGLLPFVLRPIENDLTQGDRLKYALRREETHNGIRYYAYYLRRIDKAAVKPVMEYNVIDNGNVSTSSFIPNNANHNPVPPVINNVGTNVTTGDYVSVSARLTIPLAPDTCAEMLNVAKVLFNDESYAIVSEVALCTAIDRTVQANVFGGGTFNMKEAIVVQISSFINTMIPLVFANNGATIELDVGATEPLYALEEEVVRPPALPAP